MVDNNITSHIYYKDTIIILIKYEILEIEDTIKNNNYVSYLP